MIPYNTKVIALDDRPEELREIVQGLGRAGFSVTPFYFCDGELEDRPPYPIEDVRIVFTDIHMSMGGHDPKKNANTIVSCLKKIIAPGPFVLIFWTQFPGDADEISREVDERIVEQGLKKPVGYGSLDKGAVFGVAGNNDGFDSERLRDLIKKEVEKFEPLMISLSWEDRVSRAAKKATNGLFDLVSDSNTEGIKDWGQLMAFLACEAVGYETAVKDTAAALDQAMLPLLEDQLSFVEHDSERLAANVLSKVVSEKKDGHSVPCPDNIKISKIQTGYLIDGAISKNIKSWSRGVVSLLDDDFIKSEIFANSFGKDIIELISKQFCSADLNAEDMQRVRLHAVELGPECDHVQEKLASQRYLLSILVPNDLSWAFRNQNKNPQKRKKGDGSTKNASVVDVGSFSLRTGENGTHEDWALFISCKCFMAFEKKKEFSWKPVFRLRRALIEEVSHQYVTHARRPGVMRFSV